MRIVFLSCYQNNIERGAEVFVKELSQKLSENHTVDIFTGDEANSLSKVLAGKYDVVIPVNGRFQSIKMSLGRIFGRYKLLITGHSGKGWDDILNIVIKPNVFVALTDYLAIWAKKWAWGSKVVKIPNGIDLEKFNPEGSKIKINLPRPIILSVGALAWYKHHEKVIEAVSKMQNGSVLIVGKGEEKDKLQELGDNLLKGRFQISNFSVDEMPKVYRSADLFTLPSWDREAFGIVYLEALASGVGVVAPDDLSRREIIGNGGLFVNVGDIEKYAQVLEQALKVEWKEKAKLEAEKFSWDKIASGYERILLDLR